MHIFITGTSSGIGKALAEHSLDKGNLVSGLSRTQSIIHKKYTHYAIDLSNIRAVEKFEFPDTSEKKVVLVNNAGTLGEIKYVGELSNQSIYEAYCLNLITPSILMNSFIKKYANLEVIIINISSGAGKNAYDGWGEYCSTKAGLDMFTSVIAREQKLKKSSKVRVFSVSPGIVETNMQAQIRKADFSNFSMRLKFEEYYSKGVNKTPEKSASELYKIIINPGKYPELFYDFWQG